MKKSKADLQTLVLTSAFLTNAMFLLQNWLSLASVTYWDLWRKQNMFLKSNLDQHQECWIHARSVFIFLFDYAVYIFGHLILHYQLYTEACFKLFFCVDLNLSSHDRCTVANLEILGKCMLQKAHLLQRWTVRYLIFLFSKTKVEMVLTGHLSFFVAEISC